MRLAKIILHGFKSFVEKTELEIPSGITAIVGPNGCGKTNVAEGVRWALGEQSPKSLRSHKMDDVIFGGSASRKPLGMAEVSLVFANDGTLPVPWGEVQVTRRLYRSEESEYLLNKNPCRLRDILDLFIGTGANPKAYALMDQDRLNHVLTDRPADRRALIEEAAGISRYKQQRAETLGKLEAARQNLLRVTDVMDEVKRQLGSLERQARKARQYKALSTEKQSLALSLLAAEHASLAARELQLEERMSQLRAEADAVRVKLSTLAARKASERVQIQEAEHRLGDLRQAVQKTQGEVERLLQRREQLELQLAELAEEDLRLQEECRLIAERRAGLAAEREAKGGALAGALENQRQRARELETLIAQSEAAKARLGSGRERLEALRQEQIRVAWERSEITRALAELKEREHQLVRRHERLGGELHQCRAELSGLRTRRETLEADRASALAALAALETDRRRLEASVRETEARRAEAETKLGELRLALAACQSGLDALERLEREREGYGDGVRAIFSGAPIPGVIGTVADLLEVPAGLEAAVDAVLGERLTWVVVERFEDAKAALALLRRQDAGPATFVPLETLPRGNGLPEGRDGLRCAAGLVGSTHQNLLHYLLGRVAVVSHLAEAEALWRRNGRVATYVTLSGEVLSATGRLSGGRVGRGGELPESSLLGRKRAIRQARTERERLGSEAGAARAGLESIERDLQSLRDRQASLLRTLQTEEGRCAAGEQGLAQVGREEERLGRHLETLAAEEQELLAEIAETRRARESLDHEAETKRGIEQALEHSWAELRRALEQLEAEESHIARAVTSAQVERASLAERLEGLNRELGHLDSLDEELSARLGRSTERRQQIADRKVELERERERVARSVVEVAEERDRAEAEERAAATELQGLLDALRETESLNHDGEQELSRRRDELHAAELQATEGRVRREELEQTGRRSFGLEPPDLLRCHDPHRDPDQARARLGELEAKLATLGPVNLVADEEYRELEERLAFLHAQHDDLVASIKDLERALRGMTRIAEERFQEAFDAINRHFGEIFSRLFEGGRAELRLIPPAEDGDGGPLETTVDLLAQPRGKRLQSVTLLSGGEKALTGLALLFAIFYYRPSPFCVLDEVDAPLDDANIDRFLRVLRELSRQTQFLVITHNRKTMEAADVLYGVTMEEPGLSRLVSVSLAEGTP